MQNEVLYIFYSRATLELAGGNLSFRHWPISANNVIAVKSLKPVQFILLWSGHSAGSIRAVLSDEWVGGREAFWVLEERTGQSNLRSRIPSPSLLAPHSPTPSLSTVKQRGMETYSLSQCSAVRHLVRQFPFCSSHLSAHISLFIEYLLCARFGSIIQIWPRTCPWKAHFLSLNLSLS